jgi:ribonucleoside-diphosphate reductase alpha chain
MPIDQVIKLVQGLELDSEKINTWKNGVERALTKFIPNGTELPVKCPVCQKGPVINQEGCMKCANCGAAKCG